MFKSSKGLCFVVGKDIHEETIFIELLLEIDACFLWISRPKSSIPSNTQDVEVS